MYVPVEYFELQHFLKVVFVYQKNVFELPTTDVISINY